MDFRSYPPVGSMPGTLAIPEDAAPPRVRIMDYSHEVLEELDIDDPQRLRRYLDEHSISWIDVQGLGDENVLRGIAEVFDIHPLALADVVHAPQRPKVDEYERQCFIVTRQVRLGDDGELIAEQVSLVLGTNYVLTFQEKYGDVLDPVRSRLRRPGSLVRKLGPDYLAYAVLDAIIDGYYPVLEHYGDLMEDLEEEVIERPSRQAVRRIYEMRRHLLALRRAIWPQRDMINALIRDESELISQNVRVYLRDCYDHVVQLMDVIETLHELNAGLMEAYLTATSNRMNEIMKVLTIIATIFIPLSFVAAIFGMNFVVFPEIHWRWGYAYFWGLCLLVAGGMLVYFRRRDWI